MAKTPEEMAQEINQGIEALKTKVESATTKTEVETIKADLTSLIEANKDVTEAQKTELADLQEQINVMKEKTTGKENSEKGSYVSFVEENLEANKDIANDRQYSANMTFKAPALMTTANVTPNVAGGFSPLFGNYIDTSIGHN